MFRVLRSHRFSINRLKLRRYLSTRFETLPPKLEVSFQASRACCDQKARRRKRLQRQDDPAHDCWQIVRQASRRSGTRSMISSVASYCFPLKASDATKWFSSNFRTRLIAVMNFG